MFLLKWSFFSYEDYFSESVMGVFCLIINGLSIAYKIVFITLHYSYLVMNEGFNMLSHI